MHIHFVVLVLFFSGEFLGVVDTLALLGLRLRRRPSETRTSADLERRILAASGASGAVDGFGIELIDARVEGLKSNRNQHQRTVSTKC